MWNEWGKIIRKNLSIKQHTGKSTQEKLKHIEESIKTEFRKGERDKSAF